MSDVLVVSTKIKKYIKEASEGMNTSASVMNALTEIIKQKCDQAIENAKKEKRKTVMDRDFHHE